MTTPFSLDDVSSSRMMSMAERQAQLVQQRRQIIRQKSRVNSNLSTNEGKSHQIVEASGYGKSQSAVAHHQVANSTASDEIVVRSPSPSELSCVSTVVVKKQCSSDEPKLTETENCSNEADKENQQQAIHLLERELDRKKKELEETKAKLEAKEKAEVNRLCKENESRQQELQLHTSSTDDDIKDTSSTDDNRHEIANVSSTTYSSVGSTLGGSDSGYQRYLDAYHHHHPPKETLLTKQPSDTSREISNNLTGASESSDLTGSRRLSSTSSSRPISRAARRSSQDSSSPVVTPKIVQTSTKETSERKSLQDESSKNQEQEPRPTKSDPREPSHRRSLPSLQQQLTSIGSANLDDPIVMRSILMNPCPKDGRIVQCCIRRNKGKATLGIGLYPEYRCYLRENKNSRTETFLMTAKKRAANKTSNYLVSMGRNDHDKDSKNILGKLRGDSKEYILFDNWKNPDDCNQEGGKKDDVRKELGAILYTSSCLGNKGPRNISVGISNTDEQGNPVKVWQPLHKHDDSMMDCLKKIDGDDEIVSNKDEKLLIHLQSKPPAWDEKLERFFLNFNGRVTMASVKNFQLVDEDGDMCLQFGRTGKDEFILDVQWPLSPFQAFALALSSFDSKVGCD